MSGGIHKKQGIVVAFVEGKRTGLSLTYLALLCNLNEKGSFLRAMSYGLSQARL